MRNKNRKLRRNWKVAIGRLSAKLRKRTAAPSGFYNGVSFFIPPLFLRRPIHLASLWSLFPSYVGPLVRPSIREVCSMRIDAKHRVSPDTLDDALYNAREPSLEVLAKIISGACTRIPVLAQTERLNRVIRLAEIGAWTEAALA